MIPDLLGIGSIAVQYASRSNQRQGRFRSAGYVFTLRLLIWSMNLE